MRKEFTRKDYENFRESLEELDRVFRFGFMASFKPEKYPPEMLSLLAGAAADLAGFQDKIQKLSALKESVSPTPLRELTEEEEREREEFGI